jgi:2-keto-4-pentenoate hydratase/2-oxohepta-3-ene-1,7-dioic acid hydratase in catechol pathway
VKLLSYFVQGRPSFGALVDEASVADLGSMGWGSLKEMIGDLSTGKVVQALRKAPLLALETIHITVPIPNTEKTILVGLNYKFHIAEAGYELPAFPSLFLRTQNSFVANEESVVKPISHNTYDFEAELAFVIGKAGRHIQAAEAMSHVAGYTLLGDHCVRDIHKIHSLTVCKNYFHSGSIGPWIVTADEIPHPEALEIVGRLNGEEMQRASISELIFDIPALIAYISSYTELVVGDIISTGTPSGVGSTRKPPVFMKAGDVFEIEVKGVGVLRNPIINEERA